ncbi:ATP-grasp domain-containing protein [Streptomyces sp. NBC_00203]|uniref:ATP-grasp domain-containing protein n=1 Tax=Streptomyces sp. NBC_00203 TaxID=2975680 RepID=UPI003244183F
MTDAASGTPASGRPVSGHPAAGRRHVVFVTWKTGNAPAFRAAKRLGHEVTLIRSLRMERSQHIDFTTSPYQEYVDTVHVLDDATDVETLRTCVATLHEERPIDGFVATVDALVVPVARIAEELGIPFTSAHGAATAKLKHRCREALAAAGVDSTRHAVVGGYVEAAAFAAEVGYPVVLKPARGSASEGAHIVHDRARLWDLWRHVRPGRAPYQDGVLVEEYLTGRFLSAEIGLSHSRFLRLAVSERKTWDRHEALEVGTTIPAAIDAGLSDRVMEFAEAAVRAVDLRLGIFHVEIMLGEDGRPRLIELNPRLMGSCLPNLFQLAGGGDPFELLVRIHLDEEVDVGEIAFSRYATVRWFGAADRVPKPAGPPPSLDWAHEYGEVLHALTLNLPDGDVLTPCRGNLGNFGEVQVVHPDHATSIGVAEEIVARAAKQLGIEVTR